MTSSKYEPVEETLHGVTVRDPYRWLENRSFSGTEEWIRMQQRRCDSYFAECRDLDAIRKRIQDYLDVEVTDQPIKKGNRYFYRRRGIGQEQACIYVREVGIGAERLLVDASPDGPQVSVGIYSIAMNGSLLAYERRDGGEDRKSIHIVDLEREVEHPDCIERGFARGFAFARDGSGYFYCQETSSAAADHTILYRPFHKSVPGQVVFRAARSHGSRLVLVADRVHLGAIWVREVAGKYVEDFWIAAQDSPCCWHPVFSGRSLPYNPLLRDGRIFVVCQELGSNRKLIELSRNGDVVRDVHPEWDGTLRGLAVTEDTVYGLLLKDMQFELKRQSLDGRAIPDITLPPDRTIHLVPNDGMDSTVFFGSESFVQPPTLFECARDQQPTLWSARASEQIPKAHKVRGTAYPSKDGTRIPVTLVIPSMPSSTAPRPAIMTSYGGFGVPMTPQFSVLVSVMLELGVVFVVPHIRGGGEFGQTWHDAARGPSRQVAFDDFLAAAEWLCGEGVTTPSQLAIFGGSNSGLLVGVAMTQRPDLFRAVLCVAPLLDMVRYENFDDAARWRHEYGTVCEPEQFAALYRYSPYHRVEQGRGYPSVLFVTGDRDTRCNPAHVRKMAARLQSVSPRSGSVIVDYSEGRGHSPTLPFSVRVDALARRVAFLCRELDLSFDSGGANGRPCA